jgi:hypothetical protein
MKQTVCLMFAPPSLLSCLFFFPFLSHSIFPLLQARVPSCFLPPGIRTGSKLDLAITAASEAEQDGRSGLLQLQEHLIASYVCNQTKRKEKMRERKKERKRREEEEEKKEDKRKRGGGGRRRRAEGSQV